MSEKCIGGEFADADKEVIDAVQLPAPSVEAAPPAAEPLDLRRDY